MNMGLFKGLDTEKPYTKADYYREMEERQEAKIAAKAAPVVVVPVRDPEWLEPENVHVSEPIQEQVVVPFVEPEVLVAAEVIAQPEIVEVVTAPPPKEEETPVKVVKQKRKKTG